jgi:cysteate synthase
MKTHAKYTLCCTLCEAEYDPDPFRLACDGDHGPALLRAIYDKKKLEIKEELPGIFRFLDRLPVERVLNNVEGKPITYESENLARHLGLSNLFISFNGYWPERDARMITCSFKELEAMSVLARVPEGHKRSIVVASAGNTGRAFSYICSRNRLPLCLVIPESNLSAIWSPHDFHSSVCLVAANGNSDYFDAISLAGHISKLEGFFAEGGAANVARRDGMGTTVLDAAVTLGRTPDHYFQAVGSGTGAIAAWEANLRLLEDGRFGSQHTKLHLSQNVPFTPMTDAWKARSRELAPMEETEVKEHIRDISAKVLSNRRPPYSIPGGLYDALTYSDGEMYSVTNAESEQASALFQELEGIDISPAAGIAAASLIQAVEAGTIGRKDCILLNITGGGNKKVKKEYSLQYLDPNITFGDQEIEPNLVAERMRATLQV